MADPTRLLASIVESSTDAIVGKSIDGTIQSWNAAAERMFGYAAGDVIGRHISLVIPPDQLEAERARMAELAAGRRVETFDTLRRRRDGRILAVALTMSPVKDAQGHVVAISTIARDVTAQKDAEARERRLLAETAETNAKFRAFFEQGALFAGIADLEGTLLEANRLSLDGCGYVREQVVGRKFWEGPWWTPSPELVARIAYGCALAASGATFREEMRYFLASGEERIADVSILPITDHVGRVVLLAPTGADITDRKRVEQALRESEARFRGLADHMSQFAWMADGTGQVVWYNKRWFDYTGTTLDEVRGWGWTIVHHPDHVDRVVARIQHSWDTGQEWEDVFPLRGRDGRYRWFLSRATPIRDATGAIVRWFGTNTDITEQRELEEDARRLSTELADLNRRKDEFLATLSHELRNPLAAVRNALAMLAVAQPDSATSARAHGVMERQVAHMARLLDDLLDVSRITQDKLHLRLEPVDVAAPVRDAVETCRSICQRAGVTVDVTLPDGPAVLEGDHTRLSQVFGNLLTNAAKYTPEGGSVALTVTTTARDIVVSVRDTGIGIPTHMLDRVFEMFSQVDEGSDASLRGLGIGLSLVKRLVEMHRGTVTAHSEGRGRGSEFVVTLPLAAASAPRPHTSAARPATSASSHRVLVVDDDRDSADSLAMVLRAAGHATATAHDGVEAVERAEHFRPDVILLDIGLPRMNGHEACRSIRALPWARDLFIVALTGWGQEADRQQTRDAGFDLHLVKPVDPAGLLAALHEHRRPA